MTLIPELIPPGDRLMGADLAEQALEGLARAPRYARLEAAHMNAAVVDVLAEDGRRASQLIYGEIFEVLFRRGGRAYGRSRRDGSVGWVAESVLKQGLPKPAYRVTSHGGALPFNALVTGDEAGLEGVELVPVAEFAADPVAVARTYLGAEVSKGARGEAVDGIGLVQQVMFACGRAAPRRADELADVGRAVKADELAPGDIVVWVSSEDSAVGHAAVVSEGDKVIHACANGGKVVETELSDVMDQAQAAGLGQAVYRRPSF